jgi:hypothetical protein
MDMAVDPDESGYSFENCGDVFESKTELDGHVEAAHGITPEERSREKDDGSRGK